MVSSCDLVDIRSKGDRFSWVGERHTHTVKCCLDRAFINIEAAANFPFAELEFLEFAGSDHKPLLLSMENTATTRTKSFFFDKRLVDIPHFKRCVKEGWENGKLTQGYQIMDQVRICRHHLARLKHRSNLNADSRIKDLQAQLNTVMSSISRTERLAIPQIQRDLAKAYNDEEKYWHQKSRNNWMIGGDRNTGFSTRVQRLGTQKTESTQLRTIKEMFATVTKILGYMLNISTLKFMLAMDGLFLL
ncbi:uncharacterized protein LOC110229278 [Arabidopsis lyrata subsp. lyrata]|uniref:uncharacterized protein LOC110229278 n=1 Tax=Arabidopsis lyrata subsp. lyrata TaxID=81972 RepID=UPI000A29C89E|nr:uncharacterized protein LOC110229278 [Arabidopsis lyrata subsp. lyrata]|eukprot:XP_020884705.1 uncharacterized protein LOC110229278 [Arabidopsis lyrata subsp. lyrata]